MDLNDPVYTPIVGNLHMRHEISIVFVRKSEGNLKSYKFKTYINKCDTNATIVHTSFPVYQFIIVITVAAILREKTNTCKD